MSRNSLIVFSVLVVFDINAIIIIKVKTAIDIIANGTISHKFSMLFICPLLLVTTYIIAIDVNFTI